MARRSLGSKALGFAKSFASLVWKLAVALAGGSWFVVKTILSFFSRAVASGVSLATGPKPVFASMKTLKNFDGTAESFENWLYSGKSTVGIILGGRGSGKSALGMKLLENWAASGRRACAMGFDKASLPRWIAVVDSVEQAPNGSVLLVDEGGVLFSSRDAMSKPNKLLSQLLLVARHKDLSIVFISQNSANLEVNSIRQADYLLLKRPSLLQKDFERNKIGKLYDVVAEDFKRLSDDAGLVYVYSDSFMGFASNSLPSFWSEKTSKPFAGVKLGGRK